MGEKLGHFCSLKEESTYIAQELSDQIHEHAQISAAILGVLEATQESPSLASLAHGECFGRPGHADAPDNRDGRVMSLSKCVRCIATGITHQRVLCVLLFFPLRLPFASLES